MGAIAHAQCGAPARTGYAARHGNNKPGSAIRFLLSTAMLSYWASKRRANCALPSPPPDRRRKSIRINVEEGRRAVASEVVEKPSQAHDAGLVTADRPDGGFCVNRPQTSPVGVGAPARMRGPPPIRLATLDQFAAGSGSRREGGPGSRHVEFMSKIRVFRPILQISLSAGRRTRARRLGIRVS